MSRFKRRPVVNAAPEGVVLHVAGREYPCDMLRDPDHDKDGVAAWVAVPREALPASTDGMTMTAAVLPAMTSLIFRLTGAPGA